MRLIPNFNKRPDTYRRDQPPTAGAATATTRRDEYQREGNAAAVDVQFTTAVRQTEAGPVSTTAFLVQAVALVINGERITPRPGDLIVKPFAFSAVSYEVDSFEPEPGRPGWLHIYAQQVGKPVVRPNG